MRAAIIGTGLIGGSIGLALKSRGLAEVVLGADSDPTEADRAVVAGAVDEALGVEEAVSRSEVIFVATPVDVIPKILDLIADAGGARLVTDVGSTKSSITSHASALGMAETFIGGHPIAGAESSGVSSARADLFEGCHWILCPGERTDADAYGELTQILRSIGASVLALDARRHDELVALTSHLPQVLAWALMEFAADIAAAPGGVPLVTAGGFRDMTRIALSSPKLWRAILADNRESMTQVLRRFNTSLTNLLPLLEKGSDEELERWMSKARDARMFLPEKPGVDPARTAQLSLTIPDRPGVLAEVTTALGEGGINIEDLQIAHAPEGRSGSLHVSVSREAAQRAAEVLIARGYEVAVDR